jgi:hypothetical protein
MNLKITFRSGEGVNHREFELVAHHMEPPSDAIAPLLVHLADLLTNVRPGDFMEVVPQQIERH